MNLYDLNRMNLYKGGRTNLPPLKICRNCREIRGGFSRVFDSSLCFVLPVFLALFWILFAPARTVPHVYGLPLLSSPLDIVSRRLATPILDHSLALPTT